MGGLDAEAVANKDPENPTYTAVTISMTVETKTAETAGNAPAIQNAAAAKNYAEENLVYLDIGLTKRVGTDPVQSHTETASLLEIIVPFVTSDKHNFTVFRYHGTEVDELTTTPNADGEKIVVGNGYITIYAKKFSTYAIAYTPGAASTGGSSSYPISLPASIPNGKLTSDRRTAAKGTTVTLTVTPDDGYTLDTLTVTDQNGRQLTVTATGSGKYTFTMPAGKVTVTASFVESGAAPCGKANCPVGRFTDTSVTAWYHDGVHYCVENGLMNGSSTTTFNPNGTTTRAQIVAILWRLEGSPVVNYAMDLSDVPDDAYYTEAVRWAEATGVVTGFTDGKFRPDSAITREQMAAILWRYAKYKGVDVSVGEDTNILSYTDAMNVGEFAVPAMQWACGSGTVQGTTDGRLDPKGKTTRAQAATILMRYCKNTVK